MPMRRCTTPTARRRSATVDLAPYLGPCRVIHAIGCGPLVTVRAPRACRARTAAARAGAHLRARAGRRWVDDFSAFAPETVEWLASQGVRLIGIDTASVDPAESKTLPSHQRLRRLDLRVLENLVLDDVPEGDYELIALPLKWVDADASPVRAILRELRPMTARRLPGPRRRRPAGTAARAVRAAARR